MRVWLALALILPFSVWAQMRNFDAAFDDDSGWAEVQSQLPPYPKQQDYLPFHVSATAAFDFSVDAKSVSVGADGAVRYTLIAKSPGGTLNVSFEGIRCSDRQYRVYAFGRTDGTWSRARGSRWEPLAPNPRIAQRLVLHKDYFCLDGGIVPNSAAALDRLKYGGKLAPQSVLSP